MSARMIFWAQYPTIAHTVNPELRVYVIAIDEGAHYSEARALVASATTGATCWVPLDGLYFKYEVDADGRARAV